MKKLMLIISVLLAGGLAADAQEVSSYDTDSTFYYNNVYNPNDYAQSPVTLPQRKVSEQSRLHTNVNMGMGFGNGGSYEFIKPTVSFDATKKWSLNFGMGIAYSNLSLRSYTGADKSVSYNDLRAITNYYSAGASYRASENLSLYGELIYAKSTPVGGNALYGGNRVSYMAVFGATYHITKSLSVGFEVRQSQNMNPYDIYNNPYSPW